MRFARSLVLLAALGLIAVPAHAYQYGPYGVEIRWDNCFGDAGVPNKNFACDTNTGTHTLVGSFVPAWDIVNVNGLEIVVDLASSSASLPAWWQLKNAGTCRQSSIVMNFVPSLTSAVCADWGQSAELGGIAAYQIGLHGPNTARILAASAVPPSSAQNLTGRAEYFAFNLVINNLKTVGTGACAGCSTPVCILFQGLRMTTPILENNRYLTGPTNLTDSDFATWQGGGGGTGAAGCPAAVPTQQRTWGAVKSLYR